MTIHRLIGQIAAKKKPVAPPFEELLELGKSCSITERRAEKAERELIRIKMLRYMSERIGDEMDAIITGVESFGMFCQGVAIPAEGMIHLSALGDDFYVFDQNTRRLIGSRTKREFRLGDPIRVVVAAVDIDRRQLELRVVEDKAAAKTTPRRQAERRLPDRPFRPAEKSDDFKSRNSGPRKGKPNSGGKKSKKNSKKNRRKK